MSKASAAQEPSMDEILASIRRIIETGEERGGAPGASLGRTIPLRLPRLEPSANSSSPEARAEDVANPAPEAVADLPRGDASSFATDAIAFDAWGQAASHPTYAMTATTADRRSSVATIGATAGLQRSADEPLADDDQLTAALESELAASWGQIDERAEIAAPSPNDSIPSATATVMMAPDADIHAASAEPVAPAPEGSDAMTEPSYSEAERARETAFDDPSRQEPAMQDRGSFEPANTDQRGFGAEPDAGGGRYTPFSDNASPLSSQMTGSLVAASFEELAHAIRNGELKSLETMAQEMLRPMLQEWLDDNLPRMVERLVREEIERMSRGGRR